MSDSRRWAVFFDLEGTLIVRATSLEQVVETVLFAHDRVRSTDVVREATEQALHEASSSDRHALSLAIFRKLALEEDADRLSAAVVEACQRVDPPVLAPGAVAALALLHGAGAILGVITNANGAVREGLAKLGIARYLDVVMTPSRGGVMKPDRRIFEAALVEAGVDAAHAWLVGDDPVGDIQGAARAGLHAVLVRGAPVDGVLTASRVDEAAALILRREAEKAR